MREEKKNSKEREEKKWENSGGHQATYPKNK